MMKHRYNTHEVGDLVNGGFGLAMIVKKELFKYHIVWFRDKDNSELRTEFQFHEISEMKESLWEKYWLAN